ncbi:MAG: PLP-dependent aminotransferase family protein [Bacteroidetes bacterium]|nr:PLP-dependent aminotransferase family protein [Bacteroidota bacterium]
MKKNSFNADDHLYLQVADGLEKMIADEVLRIGDKLPSVRVLSNEYGISMGTAFQAYYHLEGRGLIESRPKSGYYVRFNHNRFPQLPDQVKPDTLSHEVSVKEMIASIYSDIASKDVINFALGVPDTSLLPAAKLNKSVVHALRNHKDHCISYEHTQGNPELRQQIAKLSFNWGGKVKPADVIVSNGCLEAVMMCLRAVTNHGDTVAVECPTYFGIYQSIENLGLKVVEIPSDPAEGLDLISLQKAIKKYPIKACVAVPNFNNPLGTCMSDDNKKKLVEIVTQHKIPLIEDDTYGELYFGKNRPKACKFFDREGWVMYCGSVSKSLAPGYRIGWAIPGKYFEKVRQIKRVQNISSPSLTQAAVAHYLKNGRYEYHLKHLRKALHTQSLRYMQGIIQYFPADTKISRPTGGFTFWIELNPKVDSFKLRTEAMKQNISIVPGKIFAASIDFSNYIRISFGKPWSDDADYGLMMLGRLIKKMIG